MNQCFNKTSVCKTTEEGWLQRSELFKCKSPFLTYACMEYDRQSLVETCLYNFRIPNGVDGCPIILACDGSTPSLALNSQFRTCPSSINDCPPKYHGGYRLSELYRFPACLRIDKNAFKFQSTNGDYTKDNINDTMPESTESYGNQTVWVSLTVFISCLMLLGVFYILMRKVIPRLIGTSENNWNNIREKSLDDEDEEVIPFTTRHDEQDKIRDSLIAVLLERYEQMLEWRSFLHDQELPFEFINKTLMKKDYIVCNTTMDDTQNENYVQQPVDLFLVNGQRAGKVFLHGKVSCGKTCYCLKLLQIWYSAKRKEKSIASQSFSSWEEEIGKFDCVFYVPMRFASETDSHVRDIVINEFSRYHGDNEKYIKEILSNEKHSCLLILDGTDEWFPNEETKSLLRNEDVPNVDGLKNCTLLISSRLPTSLESEKTRSKIAERVKILEMRGIAKEEIPPLVEHVLNFCDKEKKSTKMHKKFKEFQEKLSQEEMESSLKSPLQAIACVHSLIENKDVRPVHTLLLCSIIDSLFNKGVRKKSLEKTFSRKKSKKVSEHAALPSWMHTYDNICTHVDELIELGAYSFQILTSNNKERTAHHGNKAKVDTSKIKLGLNPGLLLAVSSREDYYAFNKTIAEFMCAFYIAFGSSGQEAFSALLHYSADLGRSLMFSNIWRFVCGLKPETADLIGKHFVDAIMKKYFSTLSDKRYKVRTLHNIMDSCYSEIASLKEGEIETSALKLSLYVDDPTCFVVEGKDFSLTESLFVSADRKIRKSVNWDKFNEKLKEHRTLELLHVNNVYLTSVCDFSTLSHLALHSICLPSKELTELSNKLKVTTKLNTLELSYVTETSGYRLGATLKAKLSLNFARGNILRILRLSAIEISRSKGFDHLNELYLDDEMSGESVVKSLSNCKHLAKFSFTEPSSKDLSTYLTVLPILQTLVEIHYKGRKYQNSYCHESILEACSKLTKIQVLHVENASFIKQGLVLHRKLAGLRSVTLKDTSMNKECWNAFHFSLLESQQQVYVRIENSNIPRDIRDSILSSEKNDVACDEDMFLSFTKARQFVS